MRLPLALGLALLASACMDSEPLAPPEPALAKVTNTFQVTGACAPGVTGTIRYVVTPSGATLPLQCPAESRIHAVTGEFTLDVTGLRADFFFVDGVPEDCRNLDDFFPIAEFPFSTTCTVNGRDEPGKPLAVFSARFVND